VRVRFPSPGAGESWSWSGALNRSLPGCAAPSRTVRAGMAVTGSTSRCPARSSGLTGPARGPRGSRLRSGASN